MGVKLNISYLDKQNLGNNQFVTETEIDGLIPEAKVAAAKVLEKTGEGSEFLGWVELPYNYDKEEFARIKATAEKIQNNSKTLIVIGIGGSYLGARAVIDLLKTPLYNDLNPKTKIYYAGNNISSTQLNNLIQIIGDNDFSVNVISKSGTTTEPALAFRVFRELVIKKYGKENAKDHIFCTTDKAKGTLKDLADKEGYPTFVVPDDIGGRFSVLTAVGLLPIAVAGCDIDLLMKGAEIAAEKYKKTEDGKLNDALLYATIRNILYKKGKSVELLVSYEPAFVIMSEWFKQLYGESEGKDNKGIFPASANFTTDLHSLGQYIQDGARILFETVVNIKSSNGGAMSEFFLQPDPENLDGLNFLTGQNMSVVNEKAMQATVIAHTEGGVPNIIIDIDKADELNVGEMIYFFEYACAVSGYMLGVNPFNQPGVESYKKNMFALLGKPGYEKEKAALEALL